LDISYSSSIPLNAIIDDHLPTRPQFSRHEVIVDEEAFEFYARDPIECIKVLFADPEFLDDLVFQPEWHYLDKAKKVRAYHNMHMLEYNAHVTTTRAAIALPIAALAQHRTASAQHMPYALPSFFHSRTFFCSHSD
jgi:hypothetical protein